MIFFKFFLGVFAALLIIGEVNHAAEHRIKSRDDPQQLLDAAAPGDKLLFLPGLHQNKLGRYRAMLYVDKSIHIELMAGATLKLADDVCHQDRVGEITTDQDASPGKLDDFEIGGDFDRKRSPIECAELYSTTIYTVVIDKTGQGSAPDTFRWGEGKLRDTPHRDIPITGDWQELSHGVKIRFANCKGHTTGNLWHISYVGPEAYGIRIGHGLQRDHIEKVIKSDRQAIHCWRHSKNGVVADNLRIHDNTNRPVVVVNSPRGWQPPEPPTQRNNRNHLG
jgi:hypothetical protein